MDAAANLLDLKMLYTPSCRHFRLKIKLFQNIKGRMYVLKNGLIVPLQS